jgi:hypothetical protein
MRVAPVVALEIGLHQVSKLAGLEQPVKGLLVAAHQSQYILAALAAAVLAQVVYLHQQITVVMVALELVQPSQGNAFFMLAAAVAQLELLALLQLV